MPRPTLCDSCPEVATAFVFNSRDGMGGNPAYGSFRAYRCETHLQEALAHYAALPDRWVAAGVRVQRAAFPDGSCARCFVGLTDSTSAVVGAKRRSPPHPTLCIDCDWAVFGPSDTELAGEVSLA